MPLPCSAGGDGGTSRVGALHRQSRAAPSLGPFCRPHPPSACSRVAALAPPPLAARNKTLSATTCGSTSLEPRPRQAPVQRPPPHGLRNCTSMEKALEQGVTGHKNRRVCWCPREEGGVIPKLRRFRSVFQSCTNTGKGVRQKMAVPQYLLPFLP